MKLLDLIDTNTDGRRYDVSTLYADFDSYKSVVQNLAEQLKNVPCNSVAGIDALGFVLGVSVAWELGKGFLTIRKGGKLPVEVISQDFVDYSGQQKTLEIRRDALTSGDYIVIVDEWIETGSQMKAAISLIEQLDGKVSRLVTLHCDDNECTRELNKNYGIVTYQAEPIPDC